jgi:MFS family permease
MIERKRSVFFRGVLPLFVLAHFAHHMLAAQLAPLLPYFRNEFSLSYKQSALVYSAFSIANGVSQIPCGWLADRIGTRVLIAVGICGVALAGILVGISQTYFMLLVFLVLMGILGGRLSPRRYPHRLGAGGAGDTGPGAGLSRNWRRRLFFRDAVYCRVYCRYLGLANLIPRSICPHVDIRRHILQGFKAVFRDEGFCR